VQLSATAHADPLAGSDGRHPPPVADEDDTPELPLATDAAPPVPVPEDEDDTPELLLANDAAPPAPVPEDVEPSVVVPLQWRLAKSRNTVTVT
jgi:hypothetical protein